MANTWKHPVIMQEAQALMALTEDLQVPFEKAVSALGGISGQIICTGIGKSGSVATKVAVTMTSMNSPALFLHPTEAAHGGAGVITENDAILAFSRSGRAVEMVPVMDRARELGIPVVLISENDKDSLADYANVVLKMPTMSDDWGHAPTTSTLVQMAIGDAIAIDLAHMKEFREDAATIALAQKKPFDG